MKKNPRAIRVLLADDHELFRDGFRVMLNKQAGVELVGEATNGEVLLEQTNHLRPDVVITDLKMPKMDGLEAMISLKQQHPDIAVIALTNYDEEALIVDMLDAGAQGYLLKSAGKNEIVEAIKTVYGGKTYYCQHTNLRLAQLIAKSSLTPSRRRKVVVFNPREYQIIQLICAQFANKEIADRLSLSVRTVETHREHILKKMEVKNTAGVVIYAIKHGLYNV